MENRITGSAPWPEWAGWFLTVMLPAMLICVILDKDADKVLDALSWVLLAVMAAADRGRSWKRLGVALGAAALVIACAGALALSGENFSKVVENFVKYQVGVLWVVVAWLAVPVFFHAGSSQSGDSGLRYTRWIKWLVVLLLAMAVQATLSAGYTAFPKDSMKLLGAELLPYAGLFIVLVRVGGWQSVSADTVLLQDAVSENEAEFRATHENVERTAKWWSIVTRSLWLVMVAASIGMAAITLLALANPALGQAFLQADLFRVDNDAPGTYRLQFLFHHHNRAGFFAACAIFLCLAGAWGKTAWRVLGIVGASGAAVALPFTLTRGALVAAAVGMVLFIVLGLAPYKRGRWVLVAGLLIVPPLMWWVLPGEYKQHIAKIADVENYQAGEGGSIGARLVMWDTAVDMIEKRPALGFGYGFENFENAARADNPEIPNYFKDAVHAHNQWLETAAETGLPGALLLALFTALRIGGLAGAWWQSMRAKQPLAWLLLLWLCLEVVVQVYGLTNYTLRRNLGFFTYGIWAGSVVLSAFGAGEKSRCAA